LGTHGQQPLTVHCRRHTILPFFCYKRKPIAENMAGSMLRTVNAAHRGFRGDLTSFLGIQEEKSETLPFIF
jgi:hypothetical protein